MRKREKENQYPIPPQEDYYADYYPEENTPPAGQYRWYNEEERERYYAQKDAYYARRDAYYAQRDAYYASQEKEAEEEEEEYEPEETETRAERRRRKKEERRKYAPEDEEEPEKLRRRIRRRGRRRKKRVFRSLVILFLTVAVVLLLLGRAPVRNPDGLPREAGHSTILLAGTDQDGARTDTILLISLERGEPIRLLSIPRDTYVPNYTTHKINAVYGAVGGGKEGMELLMKEVAGFTGFEPDGYVLMDMDVLVRAVDLLGGVSYNVPQDMNYDDSVQNLHIHLTAGEQHLNGAQVIELFRFRSGYADEDDGRTALQKDFLRTALKQWLTPSNVKKLPDLLTLYRSEGVTADLSFRNLMWIARVLVKADLRSAVTDEVLPGWADMVDGSPVYIVEKAAAANMLREFNPYKQPEESE